jgi:endonuclease YncB( thermonuclease family)
VLRRPKPAAPSSLRLYALGAIFLLPLSIGVVLVSRNATQSDQAYKISHDLASLYSQGMDFSQTANQNIALSVAAGDGIDIQGGKCVLILSKIRVVHASDCSAATATKCSNQGYPVVTERYVLGNRSLRLSSFGTPEKIDTASGKVHDWANDASARADNFVSGLKPGEVTYAAECYLTSPDSPGGVYSRTLF